MDIRLLRHYEAELSFLREMGAEFAQSFPKVAARLGIDGVEVLDPYVERLLEGSAFLAARVQLELELQYPAFTSHLLDIIYPHYLTPIPSMMVAALAPDLANPALKDGYLVPRGSVLRTAIPEGQQTACQFRTANDLTLWPVEIVEAEYIDGRGALVAAGVAQGLDGRAGIRIRLRRHGGQPIGELPMDRLTMFLGGQAARGWQLYELLCAEVTGIVARSTDRRVDWTQPISGSIEPRGFSRNEALLPLPAASFDGYRLLQEYFAMPERFHFVDLTGLSRALLRCTGDDIDLFLVLRNGLPEISAGITAEAFTLHAVPAVNLFEKRCDRVHLTDRETEHHVVADRTAPLDFEVHSIEEVVGISGEGEDDVAFQPFFSADDFTPAGGRQPAYFTIRRRMRQRTERERLKGARTSYLGSETFLSIVDPNNAPYSAGLRQLGVRAWVSNRDLPLLLASGAKDLFHLADGGPVLSVSTPVAPTRPRPTLAQGDAAWRIIGHLSLNYLSIADTDGGPGAEALRELVGLYAPTGDRAAAKQIEGIAQVSSRPIVRRMSDEVLSTAVRGLEINLQMDESYFEGTGCYLLGAVLERFFQKYVTINSFTETVLTTVQRGEIARWQPERGLGRII